MGEFNAGKSSFVNALCGAEIARVGVTPTTATINVLRFGPPGGRIHFHDGRVEERSDTEIRTFVADLDDAAASAVRMVGPSTRCLCCKKSRSSTRLAPTRCGPSTSAWCARFSSRQMPLCGFSRLTQAGKASERSVLDRAHAAGKRVLGVLNKADQAGADDVAALLGHIAATLADRVEALVPALGARRVCGPACRRRCALGKERPAGCAGSPARTILSTHTCAQAGERKRGFGTSCRGGRPPGPGRASGRRLAGPPGHRRADLDASDTRLKAALASERLSLAANLG